MKKVKSDFYKPNIKNTEIYAKLYKEYVSLSEFFANSDNKTMENIKK